MKNNLEIFVGTILIILFTIFLTAFGSGCVDTNGSGGVDTNGSGGVDTNGNKKPQRELHAVTWLKEGNFWQVSWSEIDIEQSWTDTYGDFDVGDYSMKLGPPVEKAGMQMHELLLDGDTSKYAPLWRWIGANEYGDIFGLTANVETPVRIYSETDKTWSGTGFYTDFSSAKRAVAVVEGASIISSQYTEGKTYFEPPLTAVGYGYVNREESGDSGCKYFPGYGTICTGGEGGASDNESFYEYWDEDAGPVAMHHSYNYEDCLGFACNGRHAEQRIEVWYFGDTTTNKRLGVEREPDTYLDPTLIPVVGEPVGNTSSTFIFTILAQVNKFDKPTGIVPGYENKVGIIAQTVHDWFEFEVPKGFESEPNGIDFYLCWDDTNVDFQLYLFTAPDNPVYGFLYLRTGEVTETMKEFKRVKYLSGTYLPGKYLIGVKRTTDSEFSTGYGIIVISDQDTSADR